MTAPNGDGPVSAYSVAALPRCEECGRFWLTTANGDRWHAYWIDEGAEDKLVFYCPVCSDREFVADEDE